MDLEQLGSALVSEFEEDDESYAKVEEGAEIPRTVGKSDIEKAKGFLSQVDPQLNISLYDHMADLLKTVLRSRVPDAVQRLEQLSLQLKKARLAAEDDDVAEADLSEASLKEFVEEKEKFYWKSKPAAGDETQARVDEEGSDDDSDPDEAPAETSEGPAESDKEPDFTVPDEALPDLHHAQTRFRQAGLRLRDEELFELGVALRGLALQYKLGKVRFWGKVQGLKGDVYVAEAPYQEDVPHDDFGWVEKEEEKQELEERSDVIAEEREETEKEEEGAGENEDEENDDKENKEEGQDEEQSEETENKPEEPPVPVKAKEKVTVPPETDGTGVNECLYFACQKLGQPWRVLPVLKPEHIVKARCLKRFISGDLDSKVRGYTSYPGNEAHYLRAQIARIVASTCIAPAGYYKIAGQNDDEDDDDEEEDEENDEVAKGSIVLNKEYSFKPVKEIYSEGLKGWVHSRKAILEQGRCTPVKSGKGSGEDDEEEEEEEKEDESEENDEEKEGKENENGEDPEILKAAAESEVPLLRSIAEDKGLGGLVPWRVKLSSRIVPETAILVVRSNAWPGSYTYYDGKNFDHIYIGHGYKCSTSNYAPPVWADVEEEYPEGKDVTEHEDEEIVEVAEEAKESGDEGDVKEITPDNVDEENEKNDEEEKEKEDEEEIEKNDEEEEQKEEEKS